MSIIFKTIGFVLIAVILGLFVAKQNKDITALISLLACCGVFTCAAYYMEAVLVYLDELKPIGNLDGELIEIMLRSVCIGLITEVTALLCADTGNSALGKSVQIMGTSCILWTALPLFSSLLDLLSDILGEL